MDTQKTFYQMQKILTKIANSENLKKQFLSLESMGDKFDFLVETGNDLSIDTNFSYDDFEKLDTIFFTINKVSQDKDKITEFTNLCNLQQVYNFIKKETNKDCQIDITQSDIETFLSSFAESVSGDDLYSVAGGILDPTDLSSKYSALNKLFGMGTNLGTLLGKFFTKFKKKKKNKSSK